MPSYYYDYVVSKPDVTLMTVYYLLSLLLLQNICLETNLGQIYYLANY